MKTYRHTGSVLDVTTGAGEAELRVEAWDSAGVCTDLVGYALTNADGVLEMRLRLDDVAQLFGGRRAEPFLGAIDRNAHRHYCGPSSAPASVSRAGGTH